MMHYNIGSLYAAYTLGDEGRHILGTKKNILI